MKKSTLAAGLKAAAGSAPAAASAGMESSKYAKKEPTILIGAHLPRVANERLRKVEALPENAQKTRKHLLEEAIDLLCEHYGVAAPFGHR